MSRKSILLRALVLPYVTAILLLMGCALSTFFETEVKHLTYTPASPRMEQKTIVLDGFDASKTRQRKILQEAFTSFSARFGNINNRVVVAGSTATNANSIEVDTLSEKGYIAVRVPHAPPDFVASQIISLEVRFRYFIDITTTAQITDVPLVRRDEHLPAVNAAFPIADNLSHWEVWWLPEGEQLPIPDSEFTLENTFLLIEYVIDYGEGQNGRDCESCRIVEFQFFNGFLYLGPYFPPLAKNPDGQPMAAAMFDRCGGSVANAVATDGSLVFEHCLSNLEATTRTFTIDYASKLGLEYDFFVRTNLLGDTFVPLEGNEVEVPGQPNGFIGLIVRAIHTPTVEFPANARETYHLTATSVLTPEITASTISFGFGENYELDETPDEQPDPQQSLFLPAAARREE